MKNLCRPLHLVCESTRKTPTSEQHREDILDGSVGLALMGFIVNTKLESK